MSIFAGKTVRGEQVSVLNDGEKVASTFELTCDESKKWRYLQDIGGRKKVSVTNRRFHFEAIAEDEQYLFTASGFGNGDRSSIEEGIISNNVLLANSTCVFGIDLGLFLSLPNVSIDSIEDTQSDYGAAQNVKFTVEKGGRIPASFFGELVWLPRAGYLIEKCDIQFGDRNEPIETVFKFECGFELIDGRLIPKTSSKVEPFRKEYCRITTIDPSGASEEDFTPESLGLKTPTKPFNWNLVWISIAGLATIAAIATLRKQLHKSH